MDLVVANYRILLDQTIPFVIGQQKLTERLKEQISYEVEFRHGSLELLSAIVLAAPPTLVAISSDGGFQVAYQVAKLINAIVTFRRAWANIQKLAESPEGSSQPRVNLDINLQGVRQGQSGTININPIVLLAADATKHTVDRVVAGIDGEKLESVSIEGAAETKTLLTQEDHAILGSALEELPTTVDIVGKLYEVNFNTKRGWLQTGDGRVPVTWEEAIRRDIKEHADRDRVAFRVRPVVDRRRFKDSPVGYHVLKVWVPQGSLLDRLQRRTKRRQTRIG